MIVSGCNLIAVTMLSASIIVELHVLDKVSLISMNCFVHLGGLELRDLYPCCFENCTRRVLATGFSVPAFSLSSYLYN